MKVAYNPSQLDPNTGLPEFKNGAGLISSITDHAGHQLTFAYDNQGDLTTMTASAGEAVPREFQFSWGGSGDSQPALGAIPALANLVGLGNLTSPMFPEGLTGITDPNGRTASVQYCSNGSSSSCAQNLPQGQTGPCPGAPTSLTQQAIQAVGVLLNVEPKCVIALSDRAGGVTKFSYNQQQLSQPNPACASNATQCTAVTGPQTDQNAHAEIWTDSIDGGLRPFQQIDPLSRETLTTWNNPGTITGICTTAQSANGCESGPGNTIAGTINAAGTSQATTTLLAYEQNGELTEQQGPANLGAGESQNFRDTVLKYQESAGILQSPSGADSGGTFVADQTEKDVSTGSGTQTTKYTLDPANSADGLVTAVTDPDGKSWTIDYYPGADGKIQDGGGLIKDKIDPLGNKTSYGNATSPNNGYDPNGLPTLVYAPAQTNPTTYQYDADGNLLAATDPRNANPASLGGLNPTSATVTSGFTTYHAYDDLGQQTDEWLPKDPQQEAPSPGSTIRRAMTRTATH
jgi:YD repeat-containing protein